MPTNRFPAFFFVVALAVAAATFQSEPALAYRLPDTGQTQCYDDAGNPIGCPAPGQRFHGQDGNYAGPQPAFQDNGNGTVTDLNTGLMWQQSDDQNNIYRTWEEAADYCAGRDLGGKTDWRLPTRLELLSIVDYSRTNPAIKTTYFPDCRSFVYWSGTNVAYFANLAWYVNFDFGNDYWNFKVGTFYVRCVRGGP